MLKVRNTITANHAAHPTQGPEGKSKLRRISGGGLLPVQGEAAGKSILTRLTCSPDMFKRQTTARSTTAASFILAAMTAQIRGNVAMRGT